MTHKEAVDDLTWAARHTDIPSPLNLDNSLRLRLSFGLSGAAGMDFSLPSTDIIILVWAMMKML
jgi:hypothetical protein